MKVGQAVYTINAKTGMIDQWTYGGTLSADGEKLAFLIRDRNYCHLPMRCVFETYQEAIDASKR